MICAVRFKRHHHIAVCRAGARQRHASWVEEMHASCDRRSRRASRVVVERNVSVTEQSDVAPTLFCGVRECKWTVVHTVLMSVATEKLVVAEGKDGFVAKSF